MSRHEFVAIAAAEVGEREITANRSERILQYRDATTLGRNGVSDKDWAWCAAFVAWCVAEYIRAKGLTIKPLRSARADDWQRWPAATIFSPPTSLARAGDIVTFEFDKDVAADHVGIVSADQKKLTDHVQTIEGNTKPGSVSRDGKGNSDGVHVMSRAPRLCKRYMRWIPDA